MNRHLLLTTDGSAFSQKAVDYLATLFAEKKEFEITVFCVAPAPPSYLLSPVPGINELERQEKLEKLQAENVTWANNCVSETKKALLRKGFPEKNIHTKITIQRGDLAKTILREAKDGKYDAVVAGRRGLGKVSSWWVGSVTQKLVEYGKNVPIWIVDGNQWNKKFLVPVDLGETGLQLIDHISFILAGEKEVQIELLHVIPSLFPREEEKNLDDIQSFFGKAEEALARNFFEEAEKILKDAFLPDQIKIKIKYSPRGAARIIINEAIENNFSTVVIGRRGTGGFKDLLLGSVSSKAIFNLTEKTIWVLG